MADGIDRYLREQMQPFATRVLLQALQSRTAPRIGRAFIQSHPQEFRGRDKGGRTNHERAFTRAIYYHVYRVPKYMHVDPQWSADIEWGPIEKRGSRWGRPVRVRLYRYTSGVRYVQEIMQREPWSEDLDGVGSWRAGTRRSRIHDRIDSGRRSG